MTLVMRHPVASLAPLAVILMISAGCDDDGRDTSHPAQASKPAAEIVDCKSRSQVVPPRRPQVHLPKSVRETSLIAGPVTFTGARQWSEARSMFKPSGAELRPVKVPIIVEAGNTVVVTASPPAGRQAVFEVARDQAPYRARGPAVELIPCAPSATVANRPVGPRTPFLAGFKLDGPMCLDVEVVVAGQGEPIADTISFGRGTCSSA